jgi:proline dehydrogenase
MQELLNQGAAALQKAAVNEEAKAFVLQNPKVFNVLKKAANRYIGGDTLIETVEKVKTHNASGFKCSIEFMGESSRTETIANTATDEFIKICKEINFQKLNSAISLDLSHIGLAITKDVCMENLKRICQEASLNSTEVIISAEGHERTDDVLECYSLISKTYKHVGITLQAYLDRTKSDFEEMLKLPGRIRIVKGAFETPAGISLPRGEQLDRRFLNYVDRLFTENHLCSIATHHDWLQQEVKKLIRERNIRNDRYEFESLFGINNEQLTALKDEGYPTKIYFVYGKEWYLYLCNRLAEHPMNLFRALSDIVE